MRSKYDWNKIQRYYNEGHSISECHNKFGVSSGAIMNAKKKGLFKTRKLSESMKLASKQGKITGGEWTPEKRKAASNRLKKRFEDNPEMHPNRLCAKNAVSYPERLAIAFFEENEISYQYNEHVCGYFPDFIINKTQIIEIDGERWHSSPEQIKSDNKKDKIMKSEGYSVIRIPAKNLIENLNILFNKTTDIDEDKVKRIKIEKRKRKYCLDCGKEIHLRSTRCRSCSSIKSHKLYYKFEMTKEELYNFVWVERLPYLKIGEMFGVSDTAIRKRSKKLGVEIRKRND